MQNTINIKDVERAKRKAQRREWFQRKLYDVELFYYNHKEILLIGVPVVVSGIKGIVKYTTKRITQEKEKQIKDYYCYDRSLGHYWKLRRELTNSEWLEIDSRRKNGERLADILDSFKVLK